MKIQNSSTQAEWIGRSAPRRGENVRTPGKQTSAFRQEFEGSRPAAASAAPQSALPQVPAGLPDLFAPASFEAQMNRWWMGLMQRQNEVRMQNYENAMNGWRNVNARNRELGIPEIPPPEPPQLERVEPKEPGWWFQLHS